MLSSPIFFLHMTLSEQFKQEIDRKLANLRKIYEVFQHYFGEDKVDLYTASVYSKLPKYLAIELKASTDLYKKSTFSNEEVYCAINNICSTLEIEHPYILIWYPELTITNARRESTTVKNLFIKVSISLYDFSMAEKFTMARSYFTFPEFRYGYVHSHAEGLSRSSLESVISFRSCCLGSGPLNSTISNLCRPYSEDKLPFWGLFCVELQKYAQVESLSGGPYRYLKRINEPQDEVRYTLQDLDKMIPTCATLENISGVLSDKQIQSFFSYIFRHRVFNYVQSNGKITFNEPLINCIVKLSREFIKWADEERGHSSTPFPTRDAIKRQFLITGTVRENIINVLTSTNSVSDYHDLAERVNEANLTLCTFKNQPIKVHVDLEELSAEDATIPLLNLPDAKYFLQTILKIINYGYIQQNNYPSHSSSGEEENASSEENEFFI